MNEKQRARINFMKERVVNTIPEMDLENARILTESFRETGGSLWTFGQRGVVLAVIPLLL